jgi:uncharacterized membrane protein
VGKARENTPVALSADRAFELWTDLRRWPSFIDGLAHVERADEAWPEVGAKVRWRSRQGGRGVVTERVVTSQPGVEFATEVLEERMTGTQSARFTPGDDGGTEVALELDYEVASRGPFAGLTDFFFIRRAQTDSLRRTLRRFATEAAEESSLS